MAHFSSSSTPPRRADFPHRPVSAAIRQRIHGPVPALALTPLSARGAVLLDNDNLVVSASTDAAFHRPRGASLAPLLRDDYPLYRHGARRAAHLDCLAPPRVGLVAPLPLADHHAALGLVGGKNRSARPETGIQQPEAEEETADGAEDNTNDRAWRGAAVAVGIILRNES